MSTDYEKAVDALMKDVKDLRADMKAILGAVQGKARDYVDNARESLNESASERVEQVRQAARAVGQKYRHSVDDCAAKIGERPFVSVLAALGAGVILGGLLLRRRP